MKATIKSIATSTNHIKHPRRSRAKPIYLAASIPLYTDPAYDQALRLIKTRHPHATILPCRGLWPDTASWLATYQDVLKPVRILYILVAPDGVVGRGIFKEWLFLQRRGVPAWRVHVDGRVEPLEELVVIDAGNYRRYAAVAVPDNRPTRPVLTTDGTFYQAIPFNRRTTPKVSRYWNAAKRLVNDGDAQPLASLGPVTVSDIYGTQYDMMTDPDAIVRWWEPQPASRQFRHNALIIHRYGPPEKCWRRWQRDDDDGSDEWKSI